jgi:hypothetical protein
VRELCAGALLFTWNCSVIDLRCSRLSGPSWLMMPGSRSCSFLFSAVPLQTQKHPHGYPKHHRCQASATRAASISIQHTKHASFELHLMT